MIVGALVLGLLCASTGTGGGAGADTGAGVDASGGGGVVAATIGGAAAFAEGGTAGGAEERSGAAGSSTGSGIVGALAGVGAGLLACHDPLGGRAGPAALAGVRDAMPGTDGREAGGNALGDGDPAFIVGIAPGRGPPIGATPGVEGVPGPG